MLKFSGRNIRVCFPFLWSYNWRSRYYNSSCFLLSALIWTLKSFGFFGVVLFGCPFLGEMTPLFCKYLVTCCLSFPPPPLPHAPCVFCFFLPSSFAGLFCLPSLVLERKWSSLALDQPGLPSAVAAWGSCSWEEEEEGCVPSVPKHREVAQQLVIG